MPGLLVGVFSVAVLRPDVRRCGARVNGLYTSDARRRILSPICRTCVGLLYNNRPTVGGQCASAAGHDVRHSEERPLL
jgi:hypothetical protein